MNENENKSLNEINEINGITAPPEIPEETEQAEAEIAEASEVAESAETTEPEAPDEDDPFAGIEEYVLDRAREEKKYGRGVLRWAVAMNIAFVVCLALLITVLSLDIGGVIAEAAMRGETVYVEKTIFVREAGATTGQLSNEEIAGMLTPSVVYISVSVDGEQYPKSGTGFIIRSDGYIATNYHVIEDASSIKIKLLSNSRVYNAEMIGGDKLSDLAVLKIDAQDLPAVKFGDSDSLIVGEPVVAIGNPGGAQFAGTVSTGIVSAINRGVSIYDDNGMLQKKMTVIQTNATVNGGNSGGPLINGNGEVIGVVTMKLSNYEGIGFAIPANSARVVLDQLVETGTTDGSPDVEQGVKLGLSGAYVSEGQSMRVNTGSVLSPVYFDIENAGASGVYIIDVTEGSPLEGKLGTHDIITEVAGERVSSVEQVRSIINEYKVGDSIKIKYWRDGKLSTVDVVLAANE